jgi:signal transduction histidine kinase
MQRITDTWETAVRRDLPALQSLDSHALCDHLPEVLEALARWVEGDVAGAKAGFDALAEGHAVQRLGYGIDLATLTQEYALLRSILIRDCLGPAIDDASREALARLDEGLDEAILEAVRRYAKGRDDVRDRFISILVHDLRNPLNTIAMAAGRLLVGTEGSDERIQRSASIIVRATDRMARMIEQVVQVAREHLGGGIPLTLAPGDLGELCQDALDELAAGHPSRDLSIETRGDLRGYWDGDRVIEAMSNLLGNALQHGQDPIRVVVHEAADRQSIETTVSNAGRTPTKHEVASMFDPFRATSTRRSGLGLGLYIVRAIARAHGARIDTGATENGEGFRFTITWPRVPVEETPYRGSSPTERGART